MSSNLNDLVAVMGIDGRGVPMETDIGGLAELLAAGMAAGEPVQISAVYAVGEDQRLVELDWQIEPRRRQGAGRVDWVFVTMPDGTTQSASLRVAGRS